MLSIRCYPKFALALTVMLCFVRCGFQAQNFIQILIISVTLVVVAVPEGLPLAVTLALAFATRRMTAQNLLYVCLVFSSPVIDSALTSTSL